MRRWHHDERGIALVTAMIAVIIIGGIVIVLTGIAINETRVSARARNFETAIHAAEAASDFQLAQVNQQDAASPYATKDELGDVVLYDPTGHPSEEAWARSLLDRFDDSDPATHADRLGWITTENGEAYAFRPVNPADGQVLDVIFGVGAIPSFDDPAARIRVVKYQIAQDFFSPDFALLKGGDLKFGGSASILSPDCDPALPETTCIADVHVNGGMAQPANAAVVEGRVTVAGGECPSINPSNGCLGASDGVPHHPIPPIRARDFYNRPGSAAVDWYDLCPDGTIRPPAASGPCTSATIIWPDGDSTTFHGWDFRNGEWRATDVEGGIYYVYHADAAVRGSAPCDPPRDPCVQPVTILVESDDTATTGTLLISGNPRFEPALPGVTLIVDGDLDFQGTGGQHDACTNPDGFFSGLVSVHEQAAIAGNIRIKGAIIIQDERDIDTTITQNSSQDKVQGNMCLQYDDSLEIDLHGHWTITYWNEL